MIRESLTVTALLIASSLGFAAYLMLKPTVLRWMRKHPRRRKLAFIVQVFVPLILALALSKMEFRELHDETSPVSGWTALVFLLGPLFILSVGLQWAVEDDADDQSDRLDVLRDKVRTLEKIEDATVERLQASYEATYPQWERIRTAERPISSVDRLAEILAIRNVVAGLMLDIPKRLDGYRPFLRSGGVMRVAYFEPVAGFLVPVASVAGGLANQVSVGEHDPRFSVEDPDNPGSLAAWCAWHARGDRNPAIISDTRAYVQAPRAPDDPPFAFFSKRQAGKVRSILGYSCGMGPLSVRPTPVIMLDIDIAEYFLESDLSAYALRKILHHFAHHLAYQSDMLKLLEGEIS